MDLVKCPYCNTESSVDEVEKEGGCCPECGALISGSSLFDSPQMYSDDGYDLDDYDDEDEEEGEDVLDKEGMEFEDFEDIDLESEEDDDIDDDDDDDDF